MDADLQRLIDESAIRTLLARYARGIDRMDWELVRSCYHDDATDDHGGYRGGVDGYLEWLQGRLPNAHSTQHFLGNQLIDIDGDDAWAETYCLALLRTPGPDGGPPQDAFRRLRYCDYLQRRDGEWRISERVVAFDSARIDAVEIDGPDNGMVLGTRDRSDPAYGRSRER
jgi:ketosteroid isomerase-like protein